MGAEGGDYEGDASEDDSATESERREEDSDSDSSKGSAFSACVSHELFPVLVVCDELNI